MHTPDDLLDRLSSAPPGGPAERALSPPIPEESRRTTGRHGHCNCPSRRRTAATLEAPVIEIKKLVLELHLRLREQGHHRP